ncbi:MAG: flagellin, partial [Alphaproteobacteria bacterium]|nr:flagellin [Alphaproteobacteria bacterium]
MVQGLSINTNVGAAAALEQLNSTNKKLNTTQLRITTGLKVNSPKDDAATYAIAQRLRGDIAGTQAVKIALANGESTVNVAISAGKAIANLLIEMKAKIVQANQAGLDTASRTALHNDFKALRDQLDTIVATAAFNSVNLINQSASNITVLSTVDGSTISISAQKMDATTLGLASNVLTTSPGAAAALTAIDSAITSVADKLAALGSSAKRVEVQTDFTTSLINILTEGLGNLVDADLA